MLLCAGDNYRWVSSHKKNLREAKLMKAGVLKKIPGSPVLPSTILLVTG
jgi:hypothetical protein